MLLKICLFSPLDLRSPCLTGTWQEAATLTVVVKSTSMSQSVGQMASHTLTLVWPAVLIVGILALGWVYFTSSCTVVVHLTASVKDVFRIQRQTQDFGLSFQETSKNLQISVTRIQGRENGAMPSPHPRNWWSVWVQRLAPPSALSDFAFGANSVPLDKAEGWASPVWLWLGPRDRFGGHDDHIGCP